MFTKKYRQLNNDEKVEEIKRILAAMPEKNSLTEALDVINNIDNALKDKKVFESARLETANRTLHLSPLFTTKEMELKIKASCNELAIFLTKKEIMEMSDVLLEISEALTDAEN